MAPLAYNFIKIKGYYLNRGFVSVLIVWGHQGVTKIYSSYRLLKKISLVNNPHFYGFNLLIPLPQCHKSRVY